MSTSSLAPVERVADVMAAFPCEWFLCGGWAVDAWMARQTRDHTDVDVGIFHEDQRCLLDHLVGWELVAHDDEVPDDTAEIWNGRRLSVPGHIHARDPGGFELDVQLNARSGGDWIVNTEPRIAVPLRDCVRTTPWELPAVTPEVILFFKAVPPSWRDRPRHQVREQDEIDFLLLLPALTDEQCRWLHSAIALVDRVHPWLERLPAPGG